MNGYKQARRLLKLADVIEKNEQMFDMHYWFANDGNNIENVSELCRFANEETQTDSVPEFLASLDKKGKAALTCGTKACLAGWAVMTWPKEAKPGETISQAAQRILGLDTYSVGDLFDSSSHENDAHTAAQELREMARDALTEEILAL